MVKNNQQVFGKAVIADSSEKSPQEISLEERDRIMQGFRLSLFQCGWRDEMQAIATDIMKSSGGLSVKTMEELILEVIEEGKPLVPEDIKASVIRRIKENISSKNI